MAFSSFPYFSRRDLLVKGSLLPIATLGILAGTTTKAVAEESETRAAIHDSNMLNDLLKKEFETIAAYQFCAEGNFFKKDTTPLALLFQAHHEKHRDILIEKITLLAGEPAAPKKPDEYKTSLHIADLKKQNDALRLIVKIELDAANAYIGIITSTSDAGLAQIAARIAADDVVHWTTVSALLHAPLPAEAISFGAG